MLIYHYSPINGEFLGQGQADPDPLEKGRWLIPANATVVAPPAVTMPDAVARFDGASWSIVPDLRGTEYWIGQDRHEITEIGETIPAGATLSKPPEPPSAADVNFERDRRILAGKRVSVQGYGATIHLSGDALSRENLSEQKDLAKDCIERGLTSEPMPWRDQDNIIHILTPGQMIELWRYGVEHVRAIYAASWSIKDDPNGLPDDIAGDPRWPDGGQA